MVQRKNYSSKGFFGGLLVLFLGGTCMLVATYMHGPDLEIRFSREVNSELPANWINLNMASVLRWPQWFFSLAEAKILDGKAVDRNLTLQPGSVIQMTLLPKNMKWKQFQLKVQVVEYLPGKLLRLRVLEDSSHRLTDLFSRLEWTLELFPDDTRPGSNGTLIRGTAIAQTRHWRSRLFGRLAQRILMNQVFYPDLIKLATLRQPFSLEPNLAPPGSGM